MISRRHLLRLGGLTALGTGWPCGVLRGFAETAAPPRRLVLISHCHGWPYAAWRMRPAGMPETPSLELSVDAALEAGRPDLLQPGRRAPAGR